MGERAFIPLEMAKKGEHVAQVGIRFDAKAPATFDDGVNNCAAFAGVGAICVDCGGFERVGGHGDLFGSNATVLAMAVSIGVGLALVSL